MRQTPVIFRRAYVGEFTIPFKPVVDMSFKNILNNKAVVEKSKGCTHEFTVLLGCLESHFYDNNLCPEQSLNFRKCYEKYIKDISDKKAANKASLPAYSKSYTSMQIKNYLKQYNQE